MKKTPLFVSIPHSGLKIPPEAGWLKNIPELVLMCDVDAFVDDLYQPALKKFQIPSVCFEWHRYAVDANRFPEDISPETVQGAEQLYKTKPADSLSTKSKSPSNIHWHKTTKGDPLIVNSLPQKTHKELIQKYFDPFHEKIEKEFSNLQQEGWKHVYLMDLHSMPSFGLDFHKDPGERRPEVVIGDRGGSACSEAFRDLVLKAYKEAGFETRLNWPYQGGAITQRYGQPGLGRHSLQVELNRALYMDEKTKKAGAGYREVQSQLEQALSYILEHQKDWL